MHLTGLHACAGRGRGAFSAGPGTYGAAQATQPARGMPAGAQANRAAAAAQVGQSAREISRMADAAREKRDEAKARERERERPRESRITATAERPRGRDRERDRQATCVHTALAMRHAGWHLLLPLKMLIPCARHPSDACWGCAVRPRSGRLRGPGPG